MKEEVLIPCEYQLLREAFRKQKATYLPAIDLLPQITPPKGKVYTLSLPEAKAMDRYIEEALAAGYIHPSTSPAAASFFFCGEEGRWTEALY